MVTNLFELLNAPTSLKPKDLSTHIRMQMTLPEETRNTCSRDLFRMDIKLVNELTTCRFSRKMPKEDDPDYLSFCCALTVKDAEPIPYKYFAAEYALMKAQPGQPKDNVKALTDPWRVQAYAALYLRIAQNAETGKPKSAPNLWMTAIRQYQRFFSMAKVEESYTYQYAPDDDARQLCRETWDNFLKILLDQLSDRREDYIAGQNVEAASVCLKVLSQPESRAIDPEAFGQRSIVLAGVGGQGTILASKLVAAAAMRAGLPVKTAETIGMAQRGGSVFSHLRVGGGIHSPLIGPGGADLILGFEPAEAVRMLPYLKAGGTVVTSTRPIQPVSAMIGGAPYDPGEMLAYLEAHAGRVVTVDADRALSEIGNDKVLNVLLLGIAAETGALGFDAEQLADAVEAVLPAKLHEINKKALAYAREGMTGGFGS